MVSRPAGRFCSATRGGYDAQVDERGNPGSVEDEAGIFFSLTLAVILATFSFGNNASTPKRPVNDDGVAACEPFLPDVPKMI